MKQYFQCKMRRRLGVKSTSFLTTTGWIEARGAKVGAVVELLPSGLKWEIVEVYEHGLPGNVLKETQRLNRKSLPSVEPIS